MSTAWLCINLCLILYQGKIFCLIFTYRFGCFFHVPNSNCNFFCSSHMKLLSTCFYPCLYILLSSTKRILHLNIHSNILTVIKQAKIWLNQTTALLFLLRQIWLGSLSFSSETVTCTVVTRIVVQSPQWLSARLALIRKHFVVVLTGLLEQDLCKSQIWTISRYYSVIKLHLFLTSDCSKIIERNI